MGTLTPPLSRREREFSRRLLRSRDGQSLTPTLSAKERGVFAGEDGEKKRGGGEDEVFEDRGPAQRAGPEDSETAAVGELQPAQDGYRRPEGIEEVQNDRYSRGAREGLSREEPQGEGEFGQGNRQREGKESPIGKRVIDLEDPDEALDVRELAGSRGEQDRPDRAT